METRAMAIAFFYAVGTAAGGISGPLLFGVLIASGKRAELAIGYLIGAVLMIAAGPDVIPIHPAAALRHRR
jgi:MFS family permease